MRDVGEEGEEYAVGGGRGDGDWEGGLEEIRTPMTRVIASTATFEAAYTDWMYEFRLAAIIYVVGTHRLNQASPDGLRYSTD